jgi:small subunit ribosomal protein S2
MPYVNQRWLGGMLTNWRTIKERLNELKNLEQRRDTGDFERLTKKEGLILSREIVKLEDRLGGIRNLDKLPDLIYIVDVRREDTAVKEANILSIPVVALVDTNCDPSGVDYVIPANDDAIRAIKLMTARIADSVLEGQAIRGKELAEAAEEAGGDYKEDDLLGPATLAKMQSGELTFEDEAAPAAEGAAPETAGE